MSLTDTINNTNKQKENIKTVANNIDNKLIELGGERATDLSDVVNKMGAMVGQYKKVATGTRTVNQRGSDGMFNFPINLNFKPERLMLVVTGFYYYREPVSNVHTTYPNGWLDSSLPERRVTMEIVLNSGSSITGMLKLESFDSRNILVNLETFGTNTSNKMTINWIAIG